jgi:hypothetical protein
VLQRRGTWYQIVQQRNHRGLGEQLDLDREAHMEGPWIGMEYAGKLADWRAFFSVEQASHVKCHT